MGIGALHGFNQFIDDVPRRGLVGIAHAEIDDVLTAPAGGEFKLAGDIEYVRRQAFDARKFFHV